jgi:chromosome segregation ATPase
VKDELRAAEREVRKQAGNIDLLNERIVRHEHKISDLEQEAELMRVESIDTLKRFNDEKEMTLMLRSELKATNEALLASKAKAAGLTNNLDTAKAKIEDLQATVSRLQGELVSLDQLMSSEAARYKNEISGLDNSLLKEQSQVQKLEERLVEKSLALANAEMFGEDLLMTVLQNEDDMGDLEDEVAEKEEEIEELKAYVQELTDNSRPSSRLNTGNDARFARSSSHEDTGELSSREVSMVKGLQQLQGQLVALQAQYQLVAKQVHTRRPLDLSHCNRPPGRFQPSSRRSRLRVQRFSPASSRWHRTI